MFGSRLSHYRFTVVRIRVVVINIKLHRRRPNDCRYRVTGRKRRPIYHATSLRRVGYIPKTRRWRRIIVFSLERHLRCHETLAFYDQAAFRTGTVLPATVAFVSFQKRKFVVISTARAARRSNDIVVASRVFSHRCFALRTAFPFLRHTLRLRQLRLKLLVLQFTLFQLITVKQLIYHLRHVHCK